MNRPYVISHMCTSIDGKILTKRWGKLPGGQGATSGGQREFVPVLARAAIAVGVAGLFAETHPDPSKALSDGPNAWPLGKMEALLETLMELDAVTKRHGFLEQTVS